MTAPFRFERAWSFPVSREEMWDVLLDTTAYRGWWSWLRRFDAPRIEEGARALAVIGPPLPYTLSVQITIEHLDPARRIEASVGGDLGGHAVLELDDSNGAGAEARAGSGGPGTDATLSWVLDLRQPALRLFARVGRPVLEWGHNWVVETGVEQFRRRALAPATDLLG